MNNKTLSPAAQHVDRKIGPFTATSIVVANMVGAGIFTTSGIMAGQLPSSGWILACWLLGGLIAIAGALSYAELATRMPQVGGEYVYLKKIYHPSIGFLTGWTSFFVGFSVPIAASAMAFSEYIFEGLQGQFLNANSGQLFFIKKGTALFLILLFTGIHYMGIKLGSKVQNFLTILKIGIVVGLAGTGIALTGGKGISAFSFVTQGESSWLAFGTAMMLVMFSYSGWNASSYIAGEMKNPRKNLPLSLVLGTSIVIILYIALNLFIFQAVSYDQAKGTIAIVERASIGAFGLWMGDALGLLISLALLSSLSAFVIIGPRVYFAMARDRLFFPFASKVHPKYKVPGRSILIQGAIALIMVLIGSFEQLLVYIGFALNIFPWLAVFGIFLARKRQIGNSNAFKVWGYPVVPGFFLVSSLFLMAVNYLNRPLESTAAVVTVLIGVPCYFIWIKRFAQQSQ
ncbi:MAG: amino acid permease [Candidatus Aminicenantes bacterium]|nr:amino acid permease [Candidatus Aminicenantes bacterium]